MVEGSELKKVQTRKKKGTQMMKVNMMTAQMMSMKVSAIKIFKIL